MKSRFYAFLVHLGLSSAIAGIAVIVVFFCWYPAPLHKAIGVTEIFLMLLAIDITLGPILTFLVYKTGKASLKFDLTVIALCQLAALSYGMFTMFEGRPAFMVFSVDRFDITRALDIDADSAEKAHSNGNLSAAVSWFKPQWVGAANSQDIERRNEITFSSLHGGPDWPQLPELFVPLEQLKTQILAKAKPLAELRTFNKQNPDYTSVINEQDNTVKWLPLRGRQQDMVVLINANTASVIKVIEANPW
jgi:hypothetical protein